MKIISKILFEKYLNLNNINNVKDYSAITKFLKTYIKESKSLTLEHLITKTSKALEKKFKIKILLVLMLPTLHLVLDFSLISCTFCCVPA